MSYSLSGSSSALLSAVTRGELQCIPVSTGADAVPPRHLLPLPILARGSYKPGRLHGAEVHVVPELVISYRLMMKRYGRHLSIPRILPGYYDYINKDLELRQVKEQVYLEEVALASPCYVVFSTKYKEYGHFLIETLPKLLLARHLIDGGARFPLVAPVDPPAWVEQYLEILFHENEIFRLSEFTHEAKLAVAIVPSLLGDGSLFHPFFAELIRQYLTSQRGSTLINKRIFISRERFVAQKQRSDFRQWENEAEVKALVSAAGFDVVEPELLSILEQIRLFSGASHVVGESSSALHNTLFSSQDCSILAINYVNPVQTHLCGMLNQAVDYIIPDDGINRTWENVSKVPKKYRVSTKQLMEWLAAVLT